MLSLPSDLDALCFKVFVRCEEFDSDKNLATLFATTELAPFRAKLPQRTGTKKIFVQEVKLFLLETTLADRRALIFPFLDALCGCYPEQDALYDELHNLQQRLSACVQAAPDGPPVDFLNAPPPPGLERHYLCYAADGLGYAQETHRALQQAGLRPWLDTADALPAGRQEARQEALGECRSLLLILTPGSVTQDSRCSREWRLALQYKKPVLLLRFTPGLPPPLRLSERPLLEFSPRFAAGLDALQSELQALETPAGQARQVEYRLAEARDDLRDAAPDQQARIQADIRQLEQDAQRLRAIARDPQAAARQSDERIRAAMQRASQPAQWDAERAQGKFINPPPLIAPSYFQDRHVENSLIAAFLRDPAQRLLTVTGRGGVGKTALVCRLLKALEAGRLPDDLGPLEVDGILYLSEVGSRRISFANLHAGLLRFLPEARRAALEALYREANRGVAERLRPVLEALGECAHAPLLVLLDNLEDLLDPASHAFRDAEVEAALQTLLEAPPHPLKALLTTRIAPPALLTFCPERQATIPLDEGLPSPHAEAVLRAGDPTGLLKLRDAPGELLGRAREYTRGYPRALEALSAALNADRSTSLEELLRGTPPPNVVEALVGQAYSRLDRPAQQALQALAVYGRPVPPAAVDYLLQERLPAVDSTPILNRLVHTRFVTKEAGNYYLHPVDRRYALQRVTPEKVEGSGQKAVGRGEKADGGGEMAEGRRSSEAALNQLRRRAAEYFRRTRTPSKMWKKLDDLAPQLAEIELRLEAGDYDAAAQVLTEIDFDYLLLWGHYHLMIQQHERLQGKIEDQDLKQSSAGNLGTAYRETGQIRPAIACYKQALEWARQAEDQGDEGAWLGNLGNCYADLGETRRAIEYHEQALDIQRQIGDQNGEGADLGNLGNCYADLGETRRAIEYYEQALEIQRQIGDRRGEGNQLGNLGNRYAELGETRRAIEYYEQAMEIQRQIGDRRGEGADLTGLGLCYAELGEMRRAIEYYEQALEIDRQISDRRGEGIDLDNLGNRYAELGETRRAIEYYEQALELARQTGDRRGEGNRLTGLGNCYSDLEETRRAIEYYEQALEIDRQIDDRRGEGADLGNLGNRYAELGETRRAIEYSEQALEIDRQTGYRYGEGIDLINLAAALLDEGRLAEAIHYAEESAAIAQQTGSAQVGSYGYGTLALAQLYAGDLGAARQAARQAQAYNSPTNAPNILALLGVIAGRQGDSEAAGFFRQALDLLRGLLQATPDNYNALDTQALALAGLGDLAAARAAYQAARAVNRDPGVVRRAVRLLGQVAGGEEVTGGGC